MKTKFILAALVVAAIFTACKKKETTTTEETPTPAPVVVAKVFLINKDSSYNGTASNTQVRMFTYNSSKKLIKVSYKYGTSTSYSMYDTITYNTAGQVATVKNYSVGSSTEKASSVFTFDGSGQISSVVETGDNGKPFVRTRSFAYASGKPTSQTLAYSTGSASSSGGNVENITAMVYTSGNLTSANITGIGVVTATNDLTAANPYYGLNFESDDFINLFNQNNVLKVMDGSSPANVFINATYVYASGRVSKITDASSSPSTVTDITYKEY